MYTFPDQINEFTICPDINGSKFQSKVRVLDTGVWKSGKPESGIGTEWEQEAEPEPETATATEQEQ